MDTNAAIIKQKNGHKIELYPFYSLDEPKASIIVLHGMAEHHKRYYTFAKYLNSQGIDVYLYDHLGHGTDKTQKELGYFAKKHGFKIVVDNALEVIHYVEKNKRTQKLFLMGHSMGSLIARNVISRYDQMDGVILCGTTHPPRIVTSFGLFVTSFIKLFHGSKHRSPFINKLMFGGKQYTRCITRTSFDWLSRNNSSVGAYIHDPYCGFICTISFYHDLLKLVSYATCTANIKRTRLDLPLLIISGDQDPVGGLGKEVKQLDSLYQRLGFRNVTLKLYEDCRHELLQELNASEIMEDITNWILK